MHPILQQLIDEKAPMELNPPAVPKAISRFEREHGIELPEHYWEFLQFADGGHFFGPAGPDFYGIDQENKYYSLAYENASKADDMPGAWYVIGGTSWGDRFCIDFATGEVVQWDHETRKESNRWKDIFECIEEEYNDYETIREDRDDEEDEEAAVGPAAPQTAAKSVTDFMQKLKAANVPIKLNPPANLDSINLFDQQKKVRTTDAHPQPKPLPDDFREFLQIANGGTLFPLGPEFFGIGGPKDDWSLEAENRNRYGYYNASIYIVGYTGAGEAICIDLDSRKIVFWSTNSEKITRSWDSLLDFLEEEYRIYLKRKAYIHPSIRRLWDIGYNMSVDPPADEQAIAKFEQKRGIRLPSYYRDFLLLGNEFLLHEFNGPEPEFYGLKKLGNKASENKRVKGAVPDSLYIVGGTDSYRRSRPEILCFDMESQELVQWHPKEKKETGRWATVYDYLDEAYAYYVEHDSDASRASAPQKPCKIKNMLSSTAALYLLLADEGALAGQTVRVTIEYFYSPGSQYRGSKLIYAQISPASWADMGADRNLTVVRELSADERNALYHALKAYSGTNFAQYAQAIKTNQLMKEPQMQFFGS